jgi:hypothetical protein
MAKKSWSGNLSKFGAYLRDYKIDRDTLARGVDITPSYVSMLAHGAATPSFMLAGRIEAWTRENARKPKGAETTIGRIFLMTDWAREAA